MGATDRTAARGLAGRLHAARHRAFVGREDQLDLFRTALAADVPPFAVLHVHGPGGIGKSALLRRLHQEARAADRPAVLLDGRQLDPSPDGFRQALGAALDVDADEAVAALAARPRPVLLLDTHELSAPIDGWLRDRLVPQLPEAALVVVASRRPPSAAWRTDPAWAELLRVVALRDLQPDEARALLATRGVEPSRHDEVLRVTRGHPLALVLVAEVLESWDQSTPFQLRDAPAVIEELLDHLLRQVPGPAHRRALYAAAQVGIATEALLREALEVDDDAVVVEAFEWLRGLSFTEPVAGGVAVHDLLRDALNEEFRWRDRDGFVALHESVTRHLERRLTRTTGVEQHRAMLDMVQLFRLHPLTRRFHAWDRMGELWPEPAIPADRDAILAMAHQHEGGASAELADHWLQRQPEAFTVFREAEGEAPAGFMAHLLLGDTPGREVEVDPVVAAVWDHVRARAPLREGERIRIVRFWIARDSYQDITTHHLVSVRSSLDWITTDGLAWGFVVLADTAFYEPIFRFIDFERPPDLEVTVGSRTYGMFARDWRATSKRAWRHLLRDRRVEVADPAPRPSGDGKRLVVLAREDFVDAVRDALRGVARPGGLDGNPLLRSRVVVDAVDGGDPQQALAGLLRMAADELSGHPRDEKARRALELTYFRPAPTQEAAAERLDLPFSTFRRHLTAGVEHVVAWLWERELHGGGDG